MRDSLTACLCLLTNWRARTRRSPRICSRASAETAARRLQPSGGAVLALHCDYRVATRGKFNIGMNEVQVGLPVPRNLIAALEYVVGNRQAALLSSSGALIRPDKALEIGLVDELADPGEVVTCALGWLKEMLALPPIAMNKTRLAAKSALLERAAENTAYARVATDYWFSDETQTTMKQLVASLSKKS